MKFKPVLFTILFIMIIVTLAGCGFKRIIVKDISMEPTIKMDKNALCFYQNYSSENLPERGEIVVYKAMVDEKERFHIHRVIGLPHEKIAIKNDKVYINGEELEVSYIDVVTLPYDINEWTLGDDEVFVMGDNRSKSNDSRIIGPIKLEKIVGKVKKLF